MPTEDVMLDIAIIGGGLAGLALAHSLQARRADWQLFEARPRLGGRILTARTENGLAVDMGPAWYWPARHPSVARLVADLGLDSLAQPDDGRVLLLDDPNRPPRALAFDPATGTLAASEDAAATPGSVHGGAQRLAGGMAMLVQALSQHLPPARLNLGHALLRVTDQGSHVQLQLQGPEGPCTLHARRVVLCLPPRVAAEHIAFEPALAADVLHAMRATPTWMATAAKAAVPCARAAWRDTGLAGNAWVTHPQAVLAEVYDAGPVPGDAAAPSALAGFVWQGRLWLGGSETARQGGGYLEGALASAGRLRRQLTEAAPADAA